MTNDLHQADENTGTMEVLDRHQFDVPSLENYMQEHVEGFEGKFLLRSLKVDNLIQHTKLSRPSSPMY